MTLSVNGQIIPEEAIKYELSRLVQFYSQHMSADLIKQQMPALQKRARQQAAGARLLMDEAERLDIQVPPNLVDEKLQAIVENSGGREPFEALLKKQGLTEESLRQSVIRGLRVDLLVAQVTAEAPEPTEEELRAHYEAHMHEYVAPGRVQAQHILITPASEKEADRATARSNVESLRQKLMDGSDFADLAAAHSDCPSGRRTGGSLGWFSKGMMVPAFDEAVFALEVGDISDVVETDFGFHLIKKLGEDAGGQADFADVADKVHDFLRHVRRGEILSDHVKELTDKADIQGL